ncbi:hypothetical protein RchiOBHm_Chr1g0322721 [Rosa chinensis]|uniref:Uncharacterized protein n=1 Tax=Rosa chinensis TaxID=74649 RepID=A0A2P6S994_ROSCH|nr:hypothetical protein RchiOBHm_Chr1g0322721 [Rosa chinensis]
MEVVPSFFEAVKEGHVGLIDNQLTPTIPIRVDFLNFQGLRCHDEMIQMMDWCQQPF